MKPLIILIFLLSCSTPATVGLWKCTCENERDISLFIIHRIRAAEGPVDIDSFSSQVNPIAVRMFCDSVVVDVDTIVFYNDCPKYYQL